MKNKWLEIRAGKAAYDRLMKEGLQASDIQIFAGAAGGPKWIILYELDKYLIGEYLASIQQNIHFIGASIGAWRACAYTLSDAAAAIDRLFEAYVYQTYEGIPSPAEVSARCLSIIQAMLGPNGFNEVMDPPKHLLHVITSSARFFTADLSLRQKKFRFARAVASNMLSRRFLESHFQREIFSNSPNSILEKDILKTDYKAFNDKNLLPSLLASGSIPLVCLPVEMNAKEYWDGGMTDYHLDLNYDLSDGIVLYPHFFQKIIPGWLDKYHPFRKANPHFARNTVMLSPSDAFIQQLPNQKLTDRKDFEIYFQRDQDRFEAWNRAADLGKYLVEEFIRLQDPEILRANLMRI